MPVINKKIKIHGLNISYLDNEIDSDKTLVFIHGNSMNVESFKHQFDDSSLNNYRLLAIDLPGHGKSESTQNYSLSLFSNILFEFCAKMHLSNYVLVGHSLGGHIVIHSLSKLKNCIGVLLIGTPPLKLPLNLDQAFLPHPAMAVLFKKALSIQDISMFSNSISDDKNKSYLVNAIEHTDAFFREDLMLSIQNGDIKNEVGILQKMNSPLGLIIGKEDVLVNLNYIESLELPTLLKNEIIVMEGCSHCPHMEKPEIFNKLLTDFITMLLDRI